jgi:hypothetical protein
VEVAGRLARPNYAALRLNRGVLVLDTVLTLGLRQRPVRPEIRSRARAQIAAAQHHIFAHCRLGDGNFTRATGSEELFKGAGTGRPQGDISERKGADTGPERAYQKR